MADQPPTAGQAAGLAKIRAANDARAARLLPWIRRAQDEGVRTLGGIARWLVAQGVPPPRSRTWHATTVRNLIRRGTAE